MLIFAVLQIFIRVIIGKGGKKRYVHKTKTNAVLFIFDVIYLFINPLLGVYFK